MGFRWYPRDATRRAGPDADGLLVRVATGDVAAFEGLYDQVVGTVYGIVLRVLRDPAQSEEVTQDVMVDVWRLSTRFDRDRGSAMTWIATMAHRRAVDRVRSVEAAHDREQRTARAARLADYDDVVEQVEANLDRERVRRCLESLTTLQRQSLTMAYYEGYTYRQVAELLDTPLGTVKTRLRDGLIRLRDCLGVTS